MTNLDEYSRTMPHDRKAEQAALAAAMIDPAARSLLLATITPSMFFSEDHSIIFTAIQNMERREVGVDSITIRDELVRRGQFDEVGGIDYLRVILESIPTAVHAKHYAKIVREMATRRSIIAECRDMITRAHSLLNEAPELALRASSRFLALSTEATTLEPASFGELAVEYVDSFDSPASDCISTGIPSLDEVIRGIEPGGTMFIGGEAGHGKSALSKQIVVNAAKAGIRCGIVSLEERGRKIIRNYFSGASGVDNRKLAGHSSQKPTMSPEEIGAVIAELNGAVKLPIHVMDRAQTLEEVEAAIQIMVTKHDCKLIVVDHLHLIQVSGEKSREREVARASQTLKLIFRRFGVAGIVCCQLNRSHEHGKVPTVRSLRDSGALHFDGDVILLLHYEDAYHRGEPDYQKTNELKIIVAKDKESGGGLVPLEFDVRTQSITERIDACV